MAVNEGTFSQWLIKNIGKHEREQRRPFAYTRIEALSASGVPDIHMVLQGCELWIETKAISKGNIWIRATQYNWLSSAYRAGLRNLFVINCNFSEGALQLIHFRPHMFSQRGDLRKFYIEPDVEPTPFLKAITEIPGIVQYLVDSGS